MNQIIYIVTAGSYSDYRIVGVFTDEQLANKCVKALDEYTDNVTVEEYNTNPCVNELNSGLKPYEVYYYSDSKASCAYIDTGFGHMTTEIREFKTYDGMPGYSLYCWAEDSNHAIKIASERVARYRVNKELTEAAERLKNV